MALKGLVSKLSGKLADTFSAKSDRGPWQPSQGDFPRLMVFGPEELDALKGAGGLVALWHRGIRPQWIYVGHTEDLAATIGEAQSDPDVGLYDLNDGVYVTWANCPQEDRAGAVLYLKKTLSPAIDRSSFDASGQVPADTEPLDFPLPID